METPSFGGASSSGLTTASISDGAVDAAEKTTSPDVVTNLRTSFTFRLAGLQGVKGGGDAVGSPMKGDQRGLLESKGQMPAISKECMMVRKFRLASMELKAALRRMRRNSEVVGAWPWFSD